MPGKVSNATARLIFCCTYELCGSGGGRGEAEGVGGPGLSRDRTPPGAKAALRCQPSSSPKPSPAPPPCLACAGIWDTNKTKNRGEVWITPLYFQTGEGVAESPCTCHRLPWGGGSISSALGSDPAYKEAFWGFSCGKVPYSIRDTTCTQRTT